MPAPKQYICATCHSMGTPKTATKGSLAIEVLLWLCFLLPGMLYSLWRLTSRHKACPKCGSAEMIPCDTPRGQQLLRMKS